MFKRCVLSKFEWQNKPDGLTDIFIENLLLDSSENNFAVTMVEGLDDAANGEFWSNFIVMQREPKYGRPIRIQVVNALGGAYETSDFVLFNEFKNHVTPLLNYIQWYTSLIRRINKVLAQHVDASQLVATIYANSAAEAADLKRLFRGYDGIKVVEHAADALDGQKLDFVQFDITPRTSELEQLKRELEHDLFLRLGVDAGVDKTHITNLNIEDSEQPLDLVNAYELKLRQDFCDRYNARYGRDLRVKIHKITAENSIDTGASSGEEGEENGDNGNA